MELHGIEVHGVLEFYNGSQNSQKIYLRILDRIQLLMPNEIKLKKKYIVNDI